MAPGGASSYSIEDDSDAAMIFGEAWAVDERRLPRHAERPSGSARIRKHGIRKGVVGSSPTRG